MNDIYLQIGVIIIFATALAFVNRLFKQPLIPAYIIAGYLIGPEVFKLIKDAHFIQTVSEIGISFLLFMVGLELSLKKLKSVGSVATAGAAIQALAMTIIGYAAGSALGYDQKTSFYIGLIIAFSSTMVVVKLLSDKRELDTLHGHIIIGTLLMQDVLAILALSLLNSSDGFNFGFALASLLKGVMLILLIYVNSTIFPIVFKEAAENQELLLLTSLSVCFLFSFLAKFFGFSFAIGSFIAGVSLANLPWTLEIISRIRPLRDFFLTLFFVSLGMGVSLHNIHSLIFPIIIITLLILVIKPIISMFITSAFGYTKRISFLTSLSLAQVSEFSLILVANGVAKGHLKPELNTIIIIATFITITATSYFIKFDQHIYKKVQKTLSFFDLIGNARHLQFIPEKKISYDVVLIGYNRIGYSILKSLHKENKKVLVIDFNPDIIRYLIKKKVPCLYGDIADPEILTRIDFSSAKLIISTIPDVDDNIFLERKIRQVNKNAKIFVTANTVDEALTLYNKGADYVILPHFIGGNHVSLLLEKMEKDGNRIKKAKELHINELTECKELGHLCPVDFSNVK